MRIVICWPQISGYMAACWRALAQMPDVELEVLAFDSSPASNPRKGIATVTNAPFRPQVVAGFNARLLNMQERNDPSLISSLVHEKHPDVLVLAGWFHRPYVRLAFDQQLRRVPIVMGMDTPLKVAMGTWLDAVRQLAGRFRHRSYLRRVSAVVVPGERSWQCARMLNVPESRIVRGVYGVDYDAFAPLHDQRCTLAGGWPKRFLFMGRYDAMKGIDVLLEAHRRYRSAVSDPWPLTCCGQGPEAAAIARAAAASGGLVEDRGFVQPGDLKDVMLTCGAFVLASRFDPWPLVIVESCAAGFPVICTESCGSAVENVRPYYNGLLATTGDPQSLYRCMRWFHEHHDVLPEWGRRSQQFAAAYSAQVWARRWQALLQAQISD